MVAWLPDTRLAHPLDQFRGMHALVEKGSDVEAVAARFMTTPAVVRQRLKLASVYERFGLNDRQIEILTWAAPKRDYYCQSRRGNRLFDLGLGAIALAFSAASSKSDQIRIGELFAEHGREGFAAAWLRHRHLDWAADLLADLELPSP